MITPGTWTGHIRVHFSEGGEIMGELGVYEFWFLFDVYFQLFFIVLNNSITQNLIKAQTKLKNTKSLP
jgi:hypothetical protein